MKRIIANELLPVYQTTDAGEKVIDGRDLHIYLNVSTRFNDWVSRQIAKYGFVDGEDFYSFLSKTENGGRPSTEYILKLDMAKELAMVENNEQGRKARRYFIEVEKRMQQGPPMVPLAEPETEYDRITKMLQMLRMGERDRLFTPETDRSMRMQIAGMVLRQAVSPDPLPAPESAESNSVPDIASSSTDGFPYTTAVIAEAANVSVRCIALLATKHKLRTPKYCKYYGIWRPDDKFKQIRYNDAGRDKLLRLAAQWKKAQK